MQLPTLENPDDQNESPGRFGGGAFIDIWTSKPSIFPFWGVLILASFVGGVGFFALDLLFQAVLPLFTVADPVIMFPPLMLSLWLVLRWMRNSERSQTRRLLADPKEENLGLLVANLAHAARTGTMNYPILTMVQRLAEVGRTDTTVRLWWQRRPESVEPFGFEFEPRLLDESSSAFGELEEAIARNAKSDWTDQNRNRSNDARLRLPKGLRRTLALKGGWLILGCLGFMTLMEGTKSILQHRVTLNLMIFGSLIFLFLLGPVGTSPFSKKQWFIAPGGLLRRHARRRDVRSELYIFDRRKSALCIVQQRNRSWLICVADDKQSDSTVATHAEVDLLLRAWLSPLAPPPVEKLVDLQ